MIALSPEAETQLDRLLAHYESLGRIEAAENLLSALERASIRIVIKPEAGLPTPRPYPAPGRHGMPWIKEAAYWIAYRAADPPVIAGVHHAAADIPNRV